MGEHPNATFIRETLDALNRGDLQALAERIADDVVWHEIGSSEPVRGKQGLADRAAQMPQDGSINVVVHDVVANDEHTIALVEATAAMGGQSLVYRTAEIFHIKDGKITERWAFSDDTDRINKFFAPPKG
jgi:ketosteroid isomerase-like protein